ncbi:MAG: outer membrane beta-barrel protein [Saprospiraceae bacterium]|nr:outer membrane beta-barrel protein [Saprospiraceae bacterium]
MKQCIFTLLLVAAIQTGLYAQTLSPEVGVNFTNVASPDYDEPTEMATRFFVGVHGQYWLSGQMAYGLSVQYSVKGYETPDDANPLIFVPARYNYLDFMPNFELKPWPFLGIFAGVNVGVMLSDQYYDGDSWEDPAFDDLVNDVDFGGVIGAKGYWKNFYLKAHFNRSFTPVLDVTYTDENGQEDQEASYFNKNFQVGLGYRIPLKKRG